MDRLIHTALHSLHSARLRQNVSSQNLANAQVSGYRAMKLVAASGLFISPRMARWKAASLPGKVNPACFRLNRVNYAKLESKPTRNKWQGLFPG